MSLAPTENVTYRLDPDRAWSLGMWLLAATVALLAFSAIGLFTSDEAALHFKYSYLTCYTFYVSVSLGALFFVLTAHVTHARWSVVVRRLGEAIMMNFWLMLLLVVPILFWMDDLYIWADPQKVAGDTLLEQKRPFLNLKFFILRIVIYFAIWIGMGGFLYRRSLRQDETGDWKLVEAMRRMSAPGLILFAFTTTFFAFDLLMSLDAHWYSTIFGVYYFAGSFIAGLAVLILVCVAAMSTGVVGKAITAEHLHDLGKLLFAFVVFWAYISVSQLLLIWMANIPEETIWYIHRWEGGWKTYSWFLIYGHFVFPFFFLLSCHTKRNRLMISLGAVWMLIVHFLDLYWVVMPTLGLQGEGGHGVPFSLIDPVLFLGMGCLFGLVLLWRLSKRPLVPVRDPYLADSIAFENQ